MSVCHVTKSLFLPELKFIKQVTNKRNKFRIFELEKVSKFEVCPKCARKCTTIYDHVYVTIRDVPLRRKQVILKIKKRRFKCKNCNSVFREPINGIRKGSRTSQRFRRHLMFESSNFETLKRVAQKNNCWVSEVDGVRYQFLETENQCSCDRLDRYFGRSSTINFREP